MSSNASALVAQKKDVRQLMESAAFMDQIKQAVPSHSSAQVMVRVATTTIQKTPRLLECSRESLLGSVIECAQLGLVPDGILGQAYLVPYGKTAQLQIGYRGLIELARRSGLVAYVVAEPVYECDEFEVLYAPDRTIKHVPDFDNAERGTFGPASKFIPAGIRGAYALVKYKTGEIDFEYLPKHKIEQIRLNSQAGQKPDAPWLNHWVEMAKKTAIRALGKRLPLSAEFQKAANLDDMNEQGIYTGDPKANLSDTVLADVAQSAAANLAAKYAKVDAQPESQPATGGDTAATETTTEATTTTTTGSPAGGNSAVIDGKYAEADNSVDDAYAVMAEAQASQASFDPFASQPNEFDNTPSRRTRGSK